MKQHPATIAKLTESELDEIRTLIEQRSAILCDASRERFFSTRIREHLEEKNLGDGTEFAENRAWLSIEYEALLERLLTQETSFFRYPAVYDALEKRILPEIQERKCGRARARCESGAQVVDGRRALLDRGHGERCVEVSGGLGN